MGRKHEHHQGRKVEGSVIEPIPDAVSSPEAYSYYYKIHHEKQNYVPFIHRPAAVPNSNHTLEDDRGTLKCDVYQVVLVGDR
jgi:hypothetical protein